MTMASTSLRPIFDSDALDQRSPRHAAEVEGATNRFAAARALFKVQAASSSKAPSPISLTRSQSTTTTSLHHRLDRSFSVSSSIPSQIDITSEPDGSCLSTACMRRGLRQTPKPITASNLTSSPGPPTPAHDGCILPGPWRTLQPLDLTRQITTRTASGAPAWYCRHDKLVVFEGFCVGGDRTSRPITKSSRGLALARRRCPKVQINVDIPCSHCQDLLRRKTWVFEERMLECSVCKNCQERCVVEHAKQVREKQEAQQHTSFGHEKQDTGADFEIEMEKEMQKVAAMQPGMRVVTGEDGRPAIAPADEDASPTVLAACLPRARADAAFIEDTTRVISDKEGRPVFAPVNSRGPLTMIPVGWPLNEKLGDSTKRDSVLQDDEDELCGTG